MEFARRSIDWLKRNWDWLKWPVALGLLTWLIYQNWDEFCQLADRPKNWFFFALAFAVYSASILLTFVRWYLLVWAQEFRFTLRDAFRLGFIGCLFNYVAPGAAGGDLVKAVLIAREQESRRAVAAASVLFDRILGLLALFIVGAFASLFEPDLLQHSTTKWVVAALWAGSVGGLVGLAVMLHPAATRSRRLNTLVRLSYVSGPIRGLMNAVRLYQAKRCVLMVAVAISIVAHFGVLSCFYLCAQALRLTEAPGYWAHLVLIPGAELAAVVVPVPGGVGPLEFGVGYGYRLAHEAAGNSVGIEMSAAAGLVAAISVRVISICVAAIGACYYLTAHHEIAHIMQESSAETQES